MNMDEFSNKATNEHTEKIADINKAHSWEMRDLVKYEGADIQKFKMLDSPLSYDDEDNNKNREAIFCGYDFTKQIEVLAQPWVYLDALKCLSDKGDKAHGFLNPEDGKRLKKQCTELVPYMDNELKFYLSNYRRRHDDSVCEKIEKKYRKLKQILETESISPTARETEKRAELKRRKEEHVSNRLAGARKTLAKQIDKNLGTNLADRKIPEKAKKVERKINDALFSSRGGKEAE